MQTLNRCGGRLRQKRKKNCEWPIPGNKIVSARELKKASDKWLIKKARDQGPRKKNSKYRVGEEKNIVTRKSLPEPLKVCVVKKIFLS